MNDDAAPLAAEHLSDDAIPPKVTQTTLAAWRSELARIRVERQDLDPELRRVVAEFAQSSFEDEALALVDRVFRVGHARRFNCASKSAGFIRNVAAMDK